MISVVLIRPYVRREEWFLAATAAQEVHTCNFEHLQFATLAICNSCNLQHVKFVTCEICNKYNL